MSATTPLAMHDLARFLDAAEASKELEALRRVRFRARIRMFISRKAAGRAAVSRN